MIIWIVASSSTRYLRRSQIRPSCGVHLKILDLDPWTIRQSQNMHCGLPAQSIDSLDRDG
jgi:hypothetical protein